MKSNRGIKKDIMKQTKVQSIVDGLYKTDKNLINSDKLLLLKFWKRQGLELTNEQMDVFFTSCTPAESITRAGRVARAREDYKLDQQVATPVRERRYRKFLGFRYKENA